MFVYALTIIPAWAIVAMFFGEKGCERHPVLATATTLVMAFGFFVLIFSQ